VATPHDEVVKSFITRADLLQTRFGRKLIFPTASHAVVPMLPVKPSGFHASEEAAVLRFCRIYDQEDSANHLHGLLLTIREDLVLFDEAHFRERLKHNPHVDSLASYGTIPK
jgi:hypothetical protein